MLHILNLEHGYTTKGINRLNGYLEELADTPFQQNFGRLSDNTVLSDIAAVTMGQSPVASSYNETGLGTIFYQGRAEFGWLPIAEAKHDQSQTYGKRGGVLMSARAPVGDLNLSHEDCCIGRGLTAIRCDYPSFGLYLMRLLCKELNTYNGEGTVFGSINGKDLKSLSRCVAQT